MRRNVAVVLAGMLVGASLVVAVPAQADIAPPWPLNCGYGGPTLPDPGTVYLDSEGAHVNIDAVGGDVDAVSQFAVDWALHWAQCILSRVPTDPAFCLADVALNIGSYYDIQGSQVHVYYPALISAAGACA